MKLVVARPEPGCAATVAAARALGFEVIAAPLFDVEPHEWVAPAPDSIDAVLLSSANAPRHAGPQLLGFLDLPCLAVGEATAEAARAAGFATVIAGDNGIQDLVTCLPADVRRVLRLAGRERTPLAVPQSIELVERVVYASETLPIDTQAATNLPGNLVLLHSARAARHLAGECTRLGLNRSSIAIAALSPAVAMAAGSGWASCESAVQPTDAALLALARGMCNTPAQR